jgi:hypothetical protein
VRQSTSHDPATPRTGDRRYFRRAILGRPRWGLCDSSRSIVGTDIGAPKARTKNLADLRDLASLDLADVRRTLESSDVVRSDTGFDDNDETRWLEVAPSGSHTRLAPNSPIGVEPGGSSIGSTTADVLGKHQPLSAIGGIDLDPEPMRVPGAPLLFVLRETQRQPRRRRGGATAT